MLGISGQAVANYIRKSPKLQVLVEEINAERIDLAEVSSSRRSKPGT